MHSFAKRLDTTVLYSQRLEHSLRFRADEIPSSAKQVLISSHKSGGRNSIQILLMGTKWSLSNNLDSIRKKKIARALCQNMA